jgi:hypothetical protein
MLNYCLERDDFQLNNLALNCYEEFLAINDDVSNKRINFGPDFMAKLQNLLLSHQCQEGALALLDQILGDMSDNIIL